FIVSAGGFVQGLANDEQHDQISVRSSPFETALETLQVQIGLGPFTGKAKFTLLSDNHNPNFIPTCGFPPTPPGSSSASPMTSDRPSHGRDGTERDGTGRDGTERNRMKVLCYIWYAHHRTGLLFRFAFEASSDRRICKFISINFCSFVIVLRAASSSSSVQRRCCRCRPGYGDDAGEKGASIVGFRWVCWDWVNIWVVEWAVEEEEATGETRVEEREVDNWGIVVQKNIILCSTGVERVVPGEKVERKSDQNPFHGTVRSTIFRTKRGTERLVPLHSVPSRVPNGTYFP
ncbi:hypothetical protein DVH24_025263, partial [Malus domestica]